MTTLKLKLFAIGLLMAMGTNAQQLHKLWETDTILKVPECVYVDTQRHVLYFSNIGGQPIRKGEGSVGKMTPDGKIIALEWIKGLNAPKGMALSGKELFVAEPAVMVVIDVKAGNVVARIPVPDAVMLNDVSAAPNGDVYVSDTRGGKIWKIKDRVPHLLIDSLKSPNGVLFTAGRFYFLDAGALYEWKDNDKKLVADGMDESTDGVEPTADGGFLVSCWSGFIYYVDAKGSHTLLLDTSADKVNAADIGWDAAKSILYVPTFWKNKVVAYHFAPK